MRPSLLFTAAVATATTTIAPWRDPEAPASMDSAPAQFTLFKLDAGNTFNAVALDGSPAAFYWHEGSSDNWAFYFQGGGALFYAPEARARAAHYLSKLNQRRGCRLVL